jgi:hypothetical protein
MELCCLYVERKDSDLSTTLRKAFGKAFGKAVKALENILRSAFARKQAFSAARQNHVTLLCPLTRCLMHPTTARLDPPHQARAKQATDMQPTNPEIC